MNPLIEIHVGFPLLDGPAEFFRLQQIGEITTATDEKIVFADEEGRKMVFFGDFAIDGTEITGTMTGFKFKDENLKLLEGSGFEVDGEALAAALGASGGGGSAAVGEDLFALLSVDNLVVKGSDFGDFIEMSFPNAIVKGRGGDDMLRGGEGNEVLKGGKGNDFLEGAGDMDKLKGGAGFDTFHFHPQFSGGASLSVEPPVAHKIKDFSHRDDTISLRPDTAGFEAGVLNDDYFRKGMEATSEDHRIIYHKASGEIYFDEDGTGPADQVHFATVKAGTKVKADDFVIELIAL